MNRRDFGRWGLELTPPDFASAVAALGVFQSTIKRWPSSLTVETIRKSLTKAAARSKRLLGWRLSVVPPGELDRPKTRHTASLFAQAWKEFAKSHKDMLRFELDLEKVEDYFWIAGQLLTPAVKTLTPAELQARHRTARMALYVRVDEPRTDVGWSWPLRVGFLQGEESGQLRQQLEKVLNTSGLKTLVDFVTLKSEGDECDLLLLPHGLRGALSEVLKAASRPRADCVLVLGGSKDLSERMTALVHAVRTQARTSGVGLLFIAEERRGEWLKGLIAELSHNNPLDVALFNVNRDLNFPTPLLAASRRLIDLTLVSRTAARLGQTLKRRVAEAPLARPSLLGPPPALPESPRKGTGAASEGFGGGDWGPPTKGAKGKPGPPIFRKGVKKNGGGGLSFATKRRAIAVADDLKRVDNWLQESGGATTVAKHSRDAQSLIKKIPRKAEDRRIQAQVFDLAARKQQRDSLKPSSSYAVDVRIGPPAAKWESAGKAFPVEKLPPSQTGHDLTIVFTELNVSRDPQVGKLFLPPVGPTEPCRFYFQTPESLEPVRARITVLHRNRVIQTAILDAPVATSGQSEKGRIKIEIEARVLPEINDLRRRQNFDAALVLNHTSDGQPGGTVVSDDKAATFSFDDASLNATIQTLNGELTNLADDPDSYPKDIAAAPTTKLLVKLAIHGRQLYNNLFVYRPENDFLLAKDKKKIQIISTRLESNLPLEFLYDYKAPNENAKLCPYAKKSLPTGQCDKACGGPKNKQTVVCPLGFWGLNRVIERHAYDGKRNLQGGTYQLKAAPSSQRQPLQVLDTALFAASEEVDRARKGTIKRVETVLKQKAKHADYVVSWKEWVKKVKANSPSLLLLLSHTEVDQQESNMPALEISKLPRLRVVDIGEEHVRKPRTNTRPLVMLVGCKTNAPDNLLHSFVPAFGTYAAIVLSTGATVLALQAAQVATELVRALSNLPQKGESTFGDVMLEVRRKLLAKGLPMVLCLSAYGDADWKLK